MDYTNKKFTLEDGKNYLVIEQVNYEGSIYLYIANPDDENDTKFVEIKDERILPIDSILFEQKIFPLFIVCLKNKK